MQRIAFFGITRLLVNNTRSIRYPRSLRSLKTNLSLIGFHHSPPYPPIFGRLASVLSLALAATCARAKIDPRSVSGSLRSPTSISGRVCGLIPKVTRIGGVTGLRVEFHAALLDLTEQGNCAACVSRLTAIFILIVEGRARLWGSFSLARRNLPPASL
jgi:hypothetical protein